MKKSIPLLPAAALFMSLAACSKTCLCFIDACLDTRQKEADSRNETTGREERELHQHGPCALALHESILRDRHGARRRQGISL